MGKTYTKKRNNRISMTVRRRWRTKKFRNKIRNVLFNKHHIDLNIKNNKKENIITLRKNDHQLLHRLAYHYLVYVLGVDEVHKYIKWFKKYIKYQYISPRMSKIYYDK